MLYQYLTFDEDNNAEDETASEESIEKDSSILINLETSKTDNLDGMCSALSAICKKKPNPKTNLIKLLLPQNN